jgi:hypothetical protein
MKSAIFVFLIFLVYSKEALSQTEFRLAPGFGIQTNNSYARQSNSPVTGARTPITGRYQLALQFDHAKKTLGYFGLNIRSTALGYVTPSGRHSVKNGSGISYGLETGIYKTISTHYLLKQKAPPKNKTLFLLAFRLRAVAALSIDRMPNFPGILDSKKPAYFCLTGICMQFFDQEKDRLSINLLYHYGFREIAQWEVASLSNGIISTGTIASRGSFFDVLLSYPLDFRSTMSSDKEL